MAGGGWMATRAGTDPLSSRQESGGGRGDCWRGRLHAARGLRGPGAAHLLHGDGRRHRAVVGAHCLAGPHACARACRGGDFRSLGAARAGPVALVRRGDADLLCRLRLDFGRNLPCAVGPHSMGDYRRAGAGGAAAVRAGLGCRSARQCRRDPGGLGGHHAARPRRRADSGRCASPARVVAGRAAAAIPGMVRGAARRAVAAACAAAVVRAARIGRRGVAALAPPLPPGHTLNALVAAPRRCLAAGSWEWDGVRFEFVHPASLEKTTRRNNQSCVLRVASNGGSMLLTGDIERLAESQIVQTNKLLGTDVLLVPHHGSRTSSSAELIQAVAPRWAVVPVGYRNRFGHPSREVLERYRAAGAEILRTDLDGAVLVRLAATRIEVQTERRRRARYWLQ